MQGLTPAVFWFEVRYHVRRPSFWLIAALFFGFGLADMVSNGSRGNAFFYVNSPSQIFQTSVWYTIFSVLAAAAFVAETFVRDARIGMESLVLATPVRKRDYLGTRFAAAFAVTTAAFSCYLPGMLLGGLAPGLNPYAIGPLRPEAYAYSYVAVVLPNLFVVSVFAFAVAARTRSIVLTYAAAVVLVMLYLAAMLMIGLDDVDYDHFRWWAMLDPFGFFALGAQSTAWTVHQHNTLMPTLSGLFAQNRLLWLVLSGIVWVLSYRGFTMALPTPGRRGSRVRAIAEPEQRPAPVHSVSTTPAAASGALAGLAIAARAAWFELELILRSRAFLILTACGLLSLFFAAAGSKSFDFSDPSTDILVHSASLYFKYILFAIVVLYAAEVTWRDRDVGLQNVIDATPVPTGTIVASKLLALFGVVTLHLLLCMLVMVIYQTVKGYFAYDLRLSAQMLFLGLGPYFYFLAVLALFCQAVLRHRYAGMAAVVLISLLPIPFDALGWFHNLYRFGASNDIGYSPMNGYGHLFTGHLWFVAYWALFSTALALLTCIVWPRGSLSDWRGHWSRSWRQSSLRIRSGLTFAGIAFGLVGTWIFYNTTVLNAYQPPGKEETSAQMERLFRQYEHLPMPVVIHTGLRIELHPEQRYFVAHGEYLLENRTGVPIREIHLSTFIHLQLAEVSYPGARLHEAHPEWGYYIYHLDEPLPPGARQTLRFVTRIEEPRGFLNQVDSDDVYMVYPNEVVGNGTNLYSPFILPFIGYTKMVEHKKAWMRHRYGLPPLEQRLRPHDDPTGLSKAMMLTHLAWGDLDVTIGTADDQIAVTTGRLVRRWQEHGRNYFQYRSRAADRGKFTIYSARYAVHRDDRFRVPIEIYYHPAHGRNVALMAQHLGQALTFYEATFGPAPFEAIKAVEFVYYDGMVFSEGGVIGLPETLVWKAELAGGGRDNLVEWMAYLIAYGWWEDQLIAADVAGAMTIREALSGYASNLYRRSIYSEAEQLALKQRQMRDFFRTLGKIDFHEPPLVDVYNEMPVAHLKGQMILETIEAQIGRPALLAAIREFFDAHKARGAPYATVLDLRDAIVRRTPPQLRAQVGELFEAVVTYRVGIADATVAPAPGGGYRVRMELETSKLYTERLGEQRSVPLDLPLSFVVKDEQGQVLRAGTIPASHLNRPVEVDVAGGRPHRVAVDPAYALPAAFVPNRERTLRPAAPDAVARSNAQQPGESTGGESN